MVEHDRQVLYRTLRDSSAAEIFAAVTYEHRRASAEPFLAIPDAIAWCWARGGDWRRRVTPVVITRRRV